MEYGSGHGNSDGENRTCGRRRRSPGAGGRPRAGGDRVPLRIARREWLKAVTDRETVRDIAKALDVSHTTVSRWIESGIPPEKVVEIAIESHVDVISALVAVGWLKPEDVARLLTSDVLRRIPTHALIAELHRRSTDGTLNVP